MEAFLIDHPSLCIRAITNYGADSCGVNLWRHPYWHYAGNFWASSCDYINTLLPTIEEWHNTKDKNMGEVDIWWFDYHSSEFWLGNFTKVDVIERKRFNHISLFTIDADLYSTPANYDIYQRIFDNATLYTSGERNNFIQIDPLEKFHQSPNLTDIWLGYLISNNTSF